MRGRPALETIAPLIEQTLSANRLDLLPVAMLIVVMTASCVSSAELHKASMTTIAR